MTVRTLLCVLVTLLVIGLALSCRGSGAGQSIVGTWEIVHMSEAPLAVDDLPANKLASGRMEFRGDGTFVGVVSMPGAPRGTNIGGTYSVEGDVIAITNSLNKTTTKSKMRFEKDYLVLEPITRESLSYATYYKRAR
jgi:hypothetical protein